MNRSSIVLIIIIAIIAAAVFYFSRSEEQAGIDGCKAETKKCPDGSAVTRAGEACEFQACPAGKFEGQVREIAASARVIKILARDDILYDIAIDQNTEIKNNSGGRVLFSNIDVGDFVRIDGTLGQNNSVLAESVELANE
jgi:hypothetical protein